MLSRSSFPRGLEVLVTSTQLSKQSNENGHKEIRAATRLRTRGRDRTKDLVSWTKAKHEFVHLLAVLCKTTR